jgi:NRPS condensation-like uncharacterized protein
MGVRKVSLNLPEELFNKLDEEAKRLGITFTDAVINAITLYFNANLGKNISSDMDLAVRKLIRDSRNWLDEFDFNRFIQLAKERGLEGSKVWNEETLSIIKPYIEKMTSGWFAPSMDKIIETLSMELCVDKDKLRKVLLPKKHKKE